MNLPNIAIGIVRDIKKQTKMAKKKLITLAKELDFTTEQEYFDYMIDTHINGQFTQCRNLFNEMSRPNQKQFILYIEQNYNHNGIRDFYFNLL